MTWTGNGLRILDLDLENIPGFYWHDEVCTDQLHTLAWAWHDDPGNVRCEQMRWSRTLGMHFPARAFEAFRKDVEAAGICTAHNINRHDRPILNGFADRNHIERIQWPKIVDTLTQLRGSKGTPRSQEYLADRYDLGEKKMHVGLFTWERAARGEPDAMAVVADRCISDVRSHIELYRELNP